jgi:hypothetical protein
LFLRRVPIIPYTLRYLYLPYHCFSALPVVTTAKNNISPTAMAYELYYWGACGEFYGRALSPLLIFEESGLSPRLRYAIDAASGLLMSRRWRGILARGAESIAPRTAPTRRRRRAGTKYVIKDQAHKPEGIFALPAIKTPSGIVVSQTPAICHVLGHELGSPRPTPPPTPKLCRFAATPWTSSPRPRNRTSLPSASRSGSRILPR